MIDYDKLEEQRQMARSNYYAQMAMIGYDASGNLLDMVHVVRCKDCKHRPVDNRTKEDSSNFNIEFPDGKCPCQCDDGWYSWYPSDDWYCANGERRSSE